MILGINVAVAPYSFGLVSNHDIVAEWTFQPSYTITENLINEILVFLEKSGVKPSDLSAVGITKGPGPYTSLRIGISVVKTLTQIFSVPLFAFSTLESFLYDYSCFDGLYFSVIPARKEEYNCAVFVLYKNTLQRLTPDFIWTTDLMKKKLNQMKGVCVLLGRFPKSMEASFQDHPFVRVLPAHLKGCSIARFTSTEQEKNTKGHPFHSIVPTYAHEPTLFIKTKTRST